MKLDHVLPWPLAVSAVLILCTFLSLVGCVDQEPIKIGFVGGLTGRVADLGIAGRDAVILAVEQLNRAGGINGQQVALLTRDDKQDVKSARQAVRELINAQTVAIIGPMTSSMAVAVKPLVDSARVVMISPTVKTDQLSGLDDFFFRVTTPLNRNAEQLADYVSNQLKLKRFAVVYDVSNRAFTETWLKVFDKALQARGGQIVTIESFASLPDLHFVPIAERVLKVDPEGVLLLSSAIDTALMAQQLRKLGSPTALFSSEWASTTNLHSFGGRAVDGMTSLHSFNADSQSERYLSFKAAFLSRFGYVPSFASTLAYDAASLLFAGLRADPVTADLKQSLLALGSFDGLQSKISIDRFGDVDRKLFLTVVDDDRFKVIE